MHRQGPELLCRRFFWGACLVLFLGCGQEPQPSSPEPTTPQFSNLVVIQIDTLRSDHLPSYGYHRDTAPFLSRLAESGIQFEGIAVSSWTRTSIATLLTGLQPQRHQTVTRADSLPENVAYLPEMLGLLGYDSRGYSANATVGTKFGFGRGYSSFHSHQGDKNNHPNAAAVTDIAVNLVKDVRRPFFLYVLYLDPHEPYVPKRSWDGRTAAEFIQPEDIYQGRAQPNSSNLRAMIAQYDAAIRETDRAIEDLINSLGSKGLLEETLVVVTSDHGEEFGEHGGITHGNTLFEEVVRVPMIVWSPEGLPRYLSQSSFFQIDFVPTVLDALGHDLPAGLDGISKWHEIVNQRTLDDDRGQLGFLDLARQYSLSIRSSSLKLIHKRGSPSNLLFDLQSDPDEKQNLVNREPDRVRLLHELFSQHNGLSALRADRQIVDIDSSTREQLAALGYMRDEPTEEELRFRDIPDHLVLYDTRVHGLFGNEPREAFNPSLDLSEESFQLVHGWLPAAPDGRRSAQQASLVLPCDHAQENSLILAGRLEDRRQGVECKVIVNNEIVSVHRITQGPFELSTQLSSCDGGMELAFVDLEIEPPSRVRGHRQSIGLFFTRAEIR